MSIEELITLVPPPGKPKHVEPLSLISEREETLGLKLPQNFVDLVQTYGSGSFSDGEFYLYNPFAQSYLRQVEEICDIFRESKSIEGDAAYPYEIFPSQPGLFPWGSHANGHTMFWLRQSDTEVWPIIIWERSRGTWERWDFSVTTFICKLLNQEIRCGMLSKES